MRLKIAERTVSMSKHKVGARKPKKHRHRYNRDVHGRQGKHAARIVGEWNVVFCKCGRKKQ